jgi:hypothetical protein
VTSKNKIAKIDGFLKEGGDLAKKVELFPDCVKQIKNHLAHIRKR